MLEVKKKIHPYTYAGLTTIPKSIAEIKDIIVSVQESTQIDWFDIVSKSRLIEVKDARHLVAYFLREKTLLSLAKIGKIINRDHSSVIHAHKRVTEMKQYDTYFKKHVSEIKETLNALN